MCATECFVISFMDSSFLKWHILVRFQVLGTVGMIIIIMTDGGYDYNHYDSLLGYYTA
jgi:hypothetical protein